MGNSYADMSDGARAEILVAVQEVSFSEWIDPDRKSEGPPEISIVMRGFATGFDRLRNQDRPVKLSIRSTSYEELFDRESKFPIGYFVFGEDEAYFAVWLRKEFFDAVLQSIPSVARGAIRFTFFIPSVDGYKSDARYPMLGYGVNVSNCERRT